MSNSEQQRVAMIQLNCPPGTRIVLDHMDDPYAPVKSGSRGSVQAVVDAGQIHMAWDNGRTLAVIPGVDTFRKLTPQELAEEQQNSSKKPDCPLIGQNGNIYNLMGIASDTLRQNGQAAQAREMCKRVVRSHSYRNSRRECRCVRWCDCEQAAPG